jgi:hypothetical protein
MAPQCYPAARREPVGMADTGTGQEKARSAMDLGWLRIALRGLASSKRALGRLIFLGWLIGFGGIVGVGAIDSMALYGPAVADASHHRPYQIKGKVSFLNDWQDRVETISRIMMPVGIAIFFGALAAHVRLRRRQADDRLQRVLRDGGPEEAGAGRGP